MVGSKGGILGRFVVCFGRVSISLVKNPWHMTQNENGHAIYVDYIDISILCPYTVCIYQ